MTGWKTINGRRYNFLDEQDQSYREWKEGVMQKNRWVNGRWYWTDVHRILR